jgi:hypothetical protein
MISQSMAAHVHTWGKPWTDLFKIYMLTNQQRLLLVSACTKIDESVVVNSTEFKSIIEDMEKYINKYKVVFFRLSTLSPKDVNSSVKATNINDIFKTIVNSFRLLEDLECEQEYSLVLRPFDDRINLKNEYRCFIVKRNCELIVNAYDYKQPDEEKDKIVRKYISEHIKLFPEDNIALDIAIYKEEVIFIEFNTFDKELDTYDSFDKLSPDAQKLTKRDNYDIYLEE